MAEAELVSYAGWEDCVRLSNGVVELVATTEVGPRIVSFGFVEGENLLYVDEEEAGLTGGDEHRMYGGHRLWYAPEHPGRSYVPDNDPVEFDVSDGVLRLAQPVEEHTGIEKELVVELADDAPRVSVTHRLTNRGLWAVELAPWGITQLGGGGTAVLPFAGGTEAYLPDRSLAFWPYTDADDDRLEFLRDHVLFSHDPERRKAKIGAEVTAEWVAYVVDGSAFVKTFELQDGTYPDRNSPVEAFTDRDLLEVETLGPLVELVPGATTEHVETWHLYGDVPEPTDSDVVEGYPFG